MKNIHLLPTEKPSRLYKDGEKLKLDIESYGVNNQNIYITNDKEIKEDEYYLTWQDYYNPPKYVIYVKSSGVNGDGKKIILTTDPELIADGVQAINNEFLEWFVKNPSCESVEVDKPISRGIPLLGYKIIIPQKEIKRKIDTCYNFDMEIGCVQDICRCEQEEPKQETLEAAMYILQNSTYGAMGKVCDEEPKQETLTYTEAAKKEERIFNSTMMSKQETLEEVAANLADPNICKTDNWISGAEWQAERMYSEKEVYDILFKHTEYFLGSGERMSLTSWFEQFKKK